MVGGCKPNYQLGMAYVADLGTLTIIMADLDPEKAIAISISFTAYTVKILHLRNVKGRNIISYLAN